MANKMTPEDLAQALLLRIGFAEVTAEVYQRIAQAETLAEAMEVATEEGVDAPGLEEWREAEIQVRGRPFGEYGPRDQPSNILSQATETQNIQTTAAEIAAGGPVAMPIAAQFDMTTKEGRDAYLLQAEAARLWALNAEEEAPEVIDSSLLFPNDYLNYTMPEQAAHIRMVTSQDYSPWGPTRTREDMRRLIEVNVPGTDVAEQAYWREQFTTPGLYASGDELITYANLSPTTRARLEEKFVQAGLLEVEGDVLGYQPGIMGFAQMNAMRTAMAAGTYFGTGYETGLNFLIADKRARDRIDAARAAAMGSGRTRQPFSVPASLREIPDYESITQDVHNIFRQRLGRDARDYELAVLADQMQEQHRNANAERIKAARAAFYAAQGGASGVMEVEVPNPQLRSQKFIEERYGNEIDRYDQIEDTSATNQLMINAITSGSRMVGGAS